MKKLANLLLILVFCAAHTACENEPPENIAEIKCSLTSKSVQALSGGLVFSKGYVQLTEVEVSGSKNGELKHASTSFDNPAQFLFIGDDPLMPIKVPIAEATYADPEVQLYFYRDPYVLELQDTIYNDPSGGEGGEDDDGDSEDDDGDDGDDDDDDDGDDDGEEDDEDDGRGDGGRKASVTGKTVNLSAYLQHAKPSIMLVGDYQGSGDIIRVLVAIDIPSIRLIPAQQNDGSLIIKKTNHISAIATFQPGYWFESITSTDIRNSALISYKGETVLFIHKDFNTGVYDKVMSGIEKSTELAFVIKE